MLCKQLRCELPSGTQPGSCLRVLSLDTSPKQEVTEVKRSQQRFSSYYSLLRCINFSVLQSAGSLLGSKFHFTFFFYYLKHG